MKRNAKPGACERRCETTLCEERIEFDELEVARRKCGRSAGHSGPHACEGCRAHELATDKNYERDPRGRKRVGADRRVPYGGSVDVATVVAFRGTDILAGEVLDLAAALIKNGLDPTDILSRALVEKRECVVKLAS